MGEGDLFFYAIAGFFVGIYMFYRGFVRMRQKKLIENTPTSKIRSLAMGLVEVYGKAVPMKNAETKKENIFLSPFSNSKCVYYKYTIEEYRRSGKNSRWVTVNQGESRQNFYLQDDTGKVTIDPKDAEIVIPMDHEFRSGGGKEPPKIVIDFLAKKNIAYKSWKFGKTMRYREYFIASKDKLYIMGSADKNPSVEIGAAAIGVENAIIKKGNAEKFYYISDKPEKDVLKAFKFSVYGGLIGGATLSVVCLAIILAYLELF
ncbi:MAG: GIDE domain-containing protein [Nanoarchaeota archaeon]|nr:GIDE domain-containing protein [Nanoarchaeota archaeon]